MFSSLSGYAQQAPSDTSPATLHTQSNIVLLDVVVTAGNKPMHGLTQDKFQVFDNGKPQQISSFEEHQPSDAPVVAKPLALDPNIYTNAPEYIVDSAANVLLLDALNTPETDQQSVRQQMIKYLKTVAPGTRIAVFTLASQLRMVEGFTTNAGMIVASLTGKDNAQPSTVLSPDFNSQLADQANVADSLGASPLAVSSMQQFLGDLTSFQTDLRVRMTLDALQELARYLSSVPGRKNLIWFSASFPLSIDPDTTLPSEFEVLRNYSSDVRLTDSMLSQARVAVYPIDARGLMVPPTSEASNAIAKSSLGLPSAMSNAGGGRHGGGATGGRAVNNSAGNAAATAESKTLLQNMQEHATMQQVAEDTGGEAFMNTNGIKEAIEQAVANGSSYYTISYSPHLENFDGSFHTLKIKVDGQYETAYRHGYYAEDLAKAKVDPVESRRMMASALQPDSPPLSELLFKVRVQPADAQSTTTPATMPVHMAKGTLMHYVIDYGVPVHSVNFTTTADGVHHAHLEFAVIAFDANGKKLNFVDQNANFDLDAAHYDQFLKYALPLHQEIDLPAGKASVRIVVHDLINQHVGAIEVPLLVLARK